MILRRGPSHDEDEHGGAFPPHSQHWFIANLLVMFSSGQQLHQYGSFPETILKKQPPDGKCYANYRSCKN